MFATRIGGSTGSRISGSNPVPRKNTATATIKRPITCLISSLAGPVRGMRRTSAGHADSTRYGSAIPAPIAANVVIVIVGDCFDAHAAAEPMNGAVHGVERTAVMIPKANEPGAVSWLGFVCFCIVANASAWPVMHRIFMPNVLWGVMILWIAPAVAAVGLGIMVRVSIRVNNTQEAQQLGGAVVLPLVILAVGQTTALLLAGVVITFLAGLVLWIIAIWLNVRGARAFTRDRMAARL